jgi:Tfp pilus assembly PilM family ATPase
MRILGLNLSDASAELVELSGGLLQRSGWTQRLRVELSEGLVTNGVIHQVEALAAKLEGQFKPGDLVMSIPEGQVYSRWLRFPVSAKLHDIRHTITERASQYFPFEAHEIAFDCLSAGSVGDQQDIFCAAVPRAVLDGYRQLAKALHCNLVRLELESLSTARAVLSNLPTAGATLLLDIGARTTIASWFTHAGLRFTFNMPLAGQYFTEQVQTSLKVTALEAERLKQKLGFTKQVQPPLEVAFVPILKGLREGMSYVQSEWQLETKEVVVLGGSAQLPKLTDYLTQQLQVSAHLPTALPWEKTYGMVSTSEQEVVYMLNAVGLALGGAKAYRHWPVVNFINSK